MRVWTNIMAAASIVSLALAGAGCASYPVIGPCTASSARAAKVDQQMRAIAVSISADAAGGTRVTGAIDALAAFDAPRAGATGKAFLGDLLIYGLAGGGTAAIANNLPDDKPSVQQSFGDINAPFANTTGSGSASAAAATTVEGN